MWQNESCRRLSSKVLLQCTSLSCSKRKREQSWKEREVRTIKKKSESAKKRAFKSRKLALFGVSHGKTRQKEGAEKKEPSNEYEILEDDSSSHEDVICENCGYCMLACEKCMDSTNCRQCKYYACEMDSVFISIECLVCDSCFCSRCEKTVLAGVPFWEGSQFSQNSGNTDFIYSSTSIRTLNCCCLMQCLHPRG